MIQRKSNKTVLFFFILVSLVFIGNILGKIKPFNHEFVIVLIFLMGIYYYYKNRLVIPLDKRLVYWFWVMFFYWIIAVIMFFVHGPSNDTALSALNIAHTFIALFFVSLLVFYHKPSIDFFWYFILVCGLAVVFLLSMEIFAMGWQGFTSGTRLGQTYLNANKIGNFANTVFIIMLGGFVWAYKKGYKFLSLWLLTLLLVFLTVVFSQARQAWIGWPEAIIAWSIYYVYLAKQPGVKIKKTHALGFIFLIFFFFILLFKFLPIMPTFEKRVDLGISDVKNYFSNETYKTSVGYRLLGYEAALDGVKNNFWMGVGEDGFREFQTITTARIATERFNQPSQGINFRHIHNQYFMSWLTKGVCGFISVILILSFMYIFFISGLRKAQVHDKPIWIAGLVFTVAYTLVFIPDSPLIRADTASHFLLFANMLVGFALVTDLKNKQSK